MVGEFGGMPLQAATPAGEHNSQGYDCTGQARLQHSPVFVWARSGTGLGQVRLGQLPETVATYET